jgi:hypothetical protein
VPSLYVGGVETFQTPSWKAAFDGQIAPHAQIVFFKSYLININYNNAFKYL